MQKFCLALLAVLIATPALAQKILPDRLFGAGTGLTFSSGVDFSSGRYGAGQTTDILVGLSDITLKQDDFQFSVSLPYLDIKGPSSVVAGDKGVPVVVKKPATPTLAASVNRSGWGDLNLSTTYSVPDTIIQDFDIDLTGRIKLATANAAKGLSSGETDFSFGVDVSRTFDIWTPFVDFGYRIPGSPTAYALNSAPSFSTGTSVQLADHVLAIVSYDFDGSISSSLADSQQLFGSASWIVSDSLTVTIYGEKGLSTGAPEFGTGLLIGWKLF